MLSDSNSVYADHKDSSSTIFELRKYDLNGTVGTDGYLPYEVLTHPMPTTGFIGLLTPDDNTMINIRAGLHIIPLADITQ
jgi:hypothetical protein